MSKQSAYQDLHRRLGLCILCPLPVEKGSYCEKCKARREAARARAIARRHGEKL